jgi:hypothetical protein
MVIRKTPPGAACTVAYASPWHCRHRSPGDSRRTDLEDARLDAPGLNRLPVQLNFRPKRFPAAVKLSGKFAMP